MKTTASTVGSITRPRAPFRSLIFRWAASCPDLQDQESFKRVEAHWCLEAEFRQVISMIHRECARLLWYCFYVHRDNVKDCILWVSALSVVTSPNYFSIISRYYLINVASSVRRSSTMMRPPTFVVSSTAKMWLSCFEWGIAKHAASTSWARSVGFDLA
jgi:hypothetical protein